MFCYSTLGNVIFQKRFCDPIGVFGNVVEFYCKYLNNFSKKKFGFLYKKNCAGVECGDKSG